jgi:hypothetical protein
MNGNDPRSHAQDAAWLVDEVCERLLRSNEATTGRPAMAPSLGRPSSATARESLRPRRVAFDAIDTGLRLVESFSRLSRRLAGDVLGVAPPSIPSPGPPTTRSTIRSTTPDVARAVARPTLTTAAGDGQKDATVLRMTGRAGSHSHAVLAVGHSSDRRLRSLRLRCNGLHGPGSATIGGRRVVFSPSRVDVAAGTVTKVDMAVAVPDDARAGDYTGVVQADGFPEVLAVLLLRVT